MDFYALASCLINLHIMKYTYTICKMNSGGKIYDYTVLILKSY